MDYKNKYEQSLERARIAYKDEDKHLKATLKRIFPELKESEDERIRKKIIATIHLYYGEPLEDEAKEMIDWLEKQGKYNIGISEATKQKLEDNLNKALEKETPESWNKFIEKQVEQNPAWTEEDMKMIEILIGIFEVNYPNSLYKVNPAGTPTMQGIYSSEIIKWLKSLKDKVLPQSQKEWSKEDERVLCKCLGALGNPNYCYEDGDLEHMRNWLKSLRPQNWTKEDKERYISCLQRLGTGNPKQPETINSKWFKEHVYPQSTWKPSDEQMKALESIFAKHGAYDDDLLSLIGDLKKLREE